LVHCVIDFFLTVVSATRERHTNQIGDTIQQEKLPTCYQVIVY